MTLNWYGEGSFRLETRGVIFSIDPFENGSGLSAPRFKADVIVETPGPIIKPYLSQKSLPEHHVFGPGEYDIQGIEIRGVAAKNSTAYVLKTEDLHIGFLGALSGIDLDPETLEVLQTSDIICIPVGGTPYIDASAAVQLLKKLEPKIVIPCFYALPGLKRKADSVSVFEKALGQHPEAQEKLSMKAREMTWEGIKLVVLKV